MVYARDRLKPNHDDDGGKTFSGNKKNECAFFQTLSHSISLAQSANFSGVKCLIKYAVQFKKRKEYCRPVFTFSMQCSSNQLLFDILRCCCCRGCLSSVSDLSEKTKTCLQMF